MVELIGQCSGEIHGPRPTQLQREVLNRPGWVAFPELVCRGTVLPHGEGKGLERVGLVSGLGEQTSNVSGEQIAAAALAQMGIPGTVYPELGTTRADDRLMSFQHHVTSAKPLR